MNTGMLVPSFVYHKSTLAILLSSLLFSCSQSSDQSQSNVDDSASSSLSNATWQKRIDDPIGATGEELRNAYREYIFDTYSGFTDDAAIDAQLVQLMANKLREIESLESVTFGAYREVESAISFELSPTNSDIVELEDSFSCSAGGAASYSGLVEDSVGIVTVEINDCNAFEMRGLGAIVVTSLEPPFESSDFGTHFYNELFVGNRALTGWTSFTREVIPGWEKYQLLYVVDGDNQELIGDVSTISDGEGDPIVSGYYLLGDKGRVLADRDAFGRWTFTGLNDSRGLLSLSSQSSFLLLDGDGDMNWDEGIAFSSVEALLDNDFSVNPTVPSEQINYPPTTGGVAIFTSYLQGDNIEIQPTVFDSDTDTENLQIRVYWEIDGVLSDFTGLTLPGAETLGANEVRIWYTVSDAEHTNESEIRIITLDPPPQ